MDLLLSALENPQSDWCIKPDKLIHNMPNSLKEEIKSLLQGNEITPDDFLTIQEHLKLSFYSGNAGIVDAKRVIECISYIGLHRSSLTNSPSRWLQARPLLRQVSGWEHRLQSEQDIHMNGRCRALSKAREFLAKKGFESQLVRGRINWSDEVAQRLNAAIDCRLNSSVAIHVLQNQLANIRSDTDGRYRFRSAPNIDWYDEPPVPWGYLFSLTLKHTSPQKVSGAAKRKAIRRVGEAIELARNYCCTFNLLPEKYAMLGSTSQRNLESIQEDILADQIYGLDQFDPHHLYQLTSDTFTNPKLKISSEKVEIYLALMQFCFSQVSPKNGLLFQVEDAYTYFTGRFSRQAIQQALCELSFSPKEINSQFMSPFCKRNAHEKPLIKHKEGYLFVNQQLSSFGFYHQLYLATENKPEVGFASERVLTNACQTSGMKIMASKSYKLESSTRQAFKIKEKKARYECDFIVETNDKIYFIELKRKTLSSPSRQGVLVDGLSDLADSVFHALKQTGFHEAVLRHQKIISFLDGTQLDLNGRDIERIAVSVFDFNSMQDSISTSTRLRYFLGREFNTEDPDQQYKLSKLNSLLQDLNDQYMKLGLHDTYQHPNLGIALNNCRFFSVMQLLKLLQDVTGNEDFGRRIDLTRNITTGSKDWYAEYDWAVRNFLKLKR
ncbi:hypothetical protein [Ferrimonas sp. YFM]|uniref:hypothetical protein n=1 Tax=Ferrimonas sp. YFM TaxID=3028878 RepID=UPI0025742E1C|nr:hypothetical protein [Ferrimonas sp. YFM]BDY04885.1 hypothetical protein F0521_19260 [Ferrimonas sp. YFM]